jgi:hypothetical protein
LKELVNCTPPSQKKNAIDRWFDNTDELKSVPKRQRKTLAFKYWKHMLNQLCKKPTLQQLEQKLIHHFHVIIDKWWKCLSLSRFVRLWNQYMGTFLYLDNSWNNIRTEKMTYDLTDICYSGDISLFLQPLLHKYDTLEISDSWLVQVKERIKYFCYIHLIKKRGIFYQDEQQMLCGAASFVMPLLTHQSPPATNKLDDKLDSTTNKLYPRLDVTANDLQQLIAMLPSTIEKDKCIFFIECTTVNNDNFDYVAELSIVPFGSTGYGTPYSKKIDTSNYGRELESVGTEVLEFLSPLLNLKRNDVCFFSSTVTATRRSLNIFQSYSLFKFIQECLNWIPLF